jgi:hypothetical protein
VKLRELFEAPRAAVMAFGRMNPPTIGHAKLVDKIKSLPGDPYIFLSQSQKPKTDPLPFQDKLRYAKFFFPEITIGNPEVKTIIQALQKIEQLGYKSLIYVAGSDRVQAFEEMINKYNGVEYNFNTIQVVSAGERDPDADGAEGMSASKMRAAAAEGDLESFKQGVPQQEVADEMFAAVRQGMGIKDTVSTEADRGFRGIGGARRRENDENDKIDAQIRADYEKKKQYELSGKFWLKTKDTQQHITDEFVGKAAANKAALELLKQQPELKGNLLITAYGPDEKQEGVAEGSEIKIPTEDGITMQDIRLMAGEGKLTKKTVLQAIAVIRKQRREKAVAEEAAGVGIVTKQNATADVPVGGEYMNVKKLFPKKKKHSVGEASYEGNIGIMELFKFFSKAEKENPKLVAHVKSLIKQGQDKQVWKIVQDYTETKLVGKEFEGSIAESIRKIMLRKIL